MSNLGILAVAIIVTAQASPKGFVTLQSVLYERIPPLDFRGNFIYLNYSAPSAEMIIFQRNNKG
jgi:hypothetical protein